MEPQINIQPVPQRSNTEIFSTIAPAISNRIIVLLEDLLINSAKTNTPNLERFFTRTSKLLNQEQLNAFEQLKDKLNLANNLEISKSLRELAADFLAPIGVGVSLKIIIFPEVLDVKYQILKIDPSSIQFIKVYGEDGFKIAKGKHHSGNIPNEFAFAIGQYALVNETAVIKDSIDYYHSLPRLIREEYFFAAILDRLIRQEVMTASAYAEKICLPVVWGEEIHHAQDKLFANLLTADVEQLPDSKILAKMFKPDSSIQKSIVCDDRHEYGVLTVILHASIIEYAAKLGAVIDVMEKSLKNELDMEAVTSFYNYLAEMEMYNRLSNQKRAASFDYKTVYALSGRHVFTGLADLGIKDFNDLFEKVQFDPVRGLSFLKQLYSRDFYNIQERNQLLNESCYQ